MSTLLPSKEFIELFKKTPGALSVSEAICIINIASNAPSGNFIELGTNRGKSAYSASYSLPDGTFYLVEPEFVNKEWEQSVLDLIATHKKNVKIIPLADYSFNVIEKYAPYSYVFWDSGEHAGEVLQQELKQLEDAVIGGGIIVMHDFDSQFVGVRKSYDYLISTGKYEEIKINWDEIKKYVGENNLEQDNNSWHHQELDFPCFVGAVKRKNIV